METPAQNLFIVEDNPMNASNLMNYLKKRFHQSLNISMFQDGETLLKNVDDKTAIVVLDYDLKGEKADQLLKDIKSINPHTEVIVLSSDLEIGTAIDAYRNGAKTVVHKGKNEAKKVRSTIYRILYFPVTVIRRFFGLKELLAIFIVEVLYILVVVLIGLYIYNKL